MSILYLTSWNESLYNASGQYLLKSFYEHKIKGDLFIGREGSNSPIGNEIYYDLTKDYFLQRWLLDNRDIIPEYLGGEGKECKCRDPYARQDWSHTKGCHFSWWNRNASRWFRKIAVLNYIINHPKLVAPDYHAFIWIDADCIFLKDPNDLLEVHFNPCFDVFYMRGKKRRAVETGIFGIKNNDLGIFFIKQLIDIYTSGVFRRYERWDDGYIFKMALGKSPLVRALDIGGNSTKNEIANFTCLTPYIKHNKGTHGRKLGIMK